MPLVTEATEGGLFTVTPSTQKFFADYSAALFANDFTPIEDRPGAEEAIKELRALFADGISCQEFKDKLYALGMFGCGRSRRLKAIAAIIGLTDEEVKDCLEQPRQDPGPQSYYLPPDTDAIQLISLPTPQDEDADFCALPGADGEDTEDLPDLKDCEAANGILDGIASLFPPPPPDDIIDNPSPNEDLTQEVPPLSQTFPLYSQRTYLDSYYTVLNLQNHPKVQGCEDFEADSEEMLERITETIRSLPPNYINPNLLPPEFEPPDISPGPRPPEIRIGLSDLAGRAANKSARSARRYAAERRMI